ADVIVDGLPWELHAPGDAGGGIGLEEGSENLQAQRVMEQDGGLRGIAHEVEACARHGRRGLGRAGAGDFPIAAACDAHGVSRASESQPVQILKEQLFCQDLFCSPYDVPRDACLQRLRDHLHAAWQTYATLCARANRKRNPISGDEVNSMTERTKRALFMGFAAAQLLWICSAATAQEKDKAPAKKIAIRAGRLIDGKSDTAILDAVILIEGDKIVSVIPGGTAPAGYELIDLSKATVLPGFADVHTHVLLNGDITAADYDEQLLKQST